MKLKKIYLLLLLGIFSHLCFSQEATLKASVSKNKLGVNQRLRIKFLINKQGADDFKPPQFKNFRVVGGPSQSVSQSWINGKSSYSQSYIYILQPLKKGEFTISPASIKINGKIIKSEALKIKVLNAVKIPENPNDPNYIAQQSIHLVAQISKSNPYVGQGVYVEYRLYFKGDISIYNYNVTELPQYNGFWNQKINIKNLSVKTGMYNGEQYRYTILEKALLIPTKSGKLTIDMMKMDVGVSIPTGRGDFFGNPITINVEQEYASSKKIIRVKELPIRKPENFSGAVGNFNFKVTPTKTTLKANESLQIKVAVNGKGNLKLFELPKIKTSKELEVYQPERKENIEITTKGLSGTLYDQYTIVPNYKGKYKIPKIAFSYFNPKEKKYYEISTDDLYINVLEGKEIVTNSDDKIPSKTNIVTTGKNFRYIQTKSTFHPIKTSDFFKSNLFYTLLFFPLILIPIGIFIAKKNEKHSKDIVGNKLRKADRLAKKYLSEAKKLFGKKEMFYEALERALHNYLKAKLNVETFDISKDKITELLQNKKVDTALINQFIDVLKNCDFARYTPITNVMIKEEYEKAKQIITQLDKQL